MRTALWITPLLLLCLPARAEWTFVDGGDGYERYIERDSILRDGPRVRVWEVDDASAPDKQGVHSLRSRTEYDCEERLYRIVHLSGHSERMTQGTILFSKAVDGEWKPVQPDTLGEVSMEMACEG